MNKNFLKSILIGAVLATSLFSFIPGVASAAKSHSGNYIEIPLSVSRKAPTMQNNVPCNGSDAIGSCSDVTAGIGMYNYVSLTPTPQQADIGNGGKLTAVNTKTKVISYITDYEIVPESPFSTNYVIRVYGLPSGTYTMSFSYNDANSSDIKSVISQTQYYCSGAGAGEILTGGQGGDPSKAKGFSIAKHLVDGCKRYNKEPFLPGAQAVLVNGNQAFDFNAAGMTPTKVSASTVAAPEPSVEQKPTDSGVTDTCPLGPDAPLRWIGCPLIELGGSTADALQGQIKNFLYTPTEQIFGNAGFMQISDTFRNLGIALIVIAGLVMVISQASGMDFVDAYTVRKLLPRMAIALIGVILAVPILQFVVTFFNDLGVWANDLIMASVHTNTTAGGATGSGTDIIQFSVATGGALVGMAFLGLGGLLSLIGTIILALLVGFLVLAVRQMVVLVTVLLAPLAIAAYVLPGTQKLWEFWKGAFITAMTIFPIIMLFIASGKALSYVLGGAKSSELSLLAILVYFAPFFLLPFAFKLAGGLMATVFSIANDRGRGGFDRLKKYRQGKVAGNAARMQTGSRFNNRSLNAMTSRATTSRMGFGKKGAAAYTDKMNLASMDFAKSAQGQALQHNDNALRALTYGSAMEARANMKRDWGMSDADIEQSIASAKAAGGFGRAQQVYAAQQLAATGTGYDSGRVDQVAQTIARASHGNANTISALAGNINSNTKSVGRHDLAPGYGALQDLSMQAAGLGTTLATKDASGRGRATNYGDAASNAWNSGSLYQHANDKSQNIKAAIKHHEALLDSTNTADKEKAAVFFNELKALQPSASGDVKAAAQESLENNRSKIETLMSSLPETPNSQREITQKVNVVDPQTGNTIEQRQGTGVYRVESGRERIERLSRTYERPDPNNL